MTEPNGRTKFEGSIAGQTISLVTKDVIPILLLVGIFALGYVRSQDLNRRVDLLHAQQVRIYEWLVQDQKHQREERQAIQRMLLTHEWNRDRPLNERLPLELSPPATPVPLLGGASQ